MEPDAPPGREQRPPGYDARLKRKVVRSSAWVGLGYGVGQMLTFGSTLVLVRLLEPKVFGVVAVAGVLLSVIARVQESGVGAALIQSRRPLEVTGPSALVFASLSGTALSLVTIALAPVYTHLVRMPEATSILQVLALVLVIRGLSVAPGSVIERALDYRSRTKADLAGAVVQATAAITCAAAGLGAWSLVAGQLSGAATQCAAVWLFAPWRPSPRNASRSVLREMLRYGRFVSGANVLNLVNNSMDTAVVGRVLGSSSAGAYSVAWRLSSMPSTFIGVIVGRVMFSVYSRIQHDPKGVRTAYLENLQRTLLLALPVTAGLAIATEPIVLALLGDRWESVVDPLRILALYGFVRLLTAPSAEVFKGIGRPHLALAAGIVFFVVGAAGLAVLVPADGTRGAALAMLVAVSVSGIVAMVITFRALELDLRMFCRALARPTACAAAVSVVLLALLPMTQDLAPWPALAILTTAGALVYGAAIAFVGLPLVRPIWTALRRT